MFVAGLVPAPSVERRKDPATDALGPVSALNPPGEVGMVPFLAHIAMVESNKTLQDLRYPSASHSLGG